MWALSHPLLTLWRLFWWDRAVGSLLGLAATPMYRMGSLQVIPRRDTLLGLSLPKEDPADLGSDLSFHLHTVLWAGSKFDALPPISTPRL